MDRDGATVAEPHSADDYYSRAVELTKLGRLDEALASYDHVLALAPEHAVALSERGSVLMRLARFAEALASIDRALAIRPDYAEALNSRGRALQGLNIFDEALASYDKAIAIAPGYAEAFNNRAAVLKDLRRFDEALASAQKAQVCAPDYADAHFTEAELHLLLGDFPAGWAEYEWRLKRTALAPVRRFSQPQWDGLASLYDRTILLYAEDGIGNAIQFCRYVPMSAARGATVILEVGEPLRRLMESLDGAARIVGTGEALPVFDLHCPLGSLPRAFGTTADTIPAATPYLHPDPAALTEWEAWLSARTRPRIGIAWAGERSHDNNHNRSIALDALAPLMDVGATIVTLQNELHIGDAEALEAHGGIADLGSARDFADAAALVSCVDLVVSVDTSIAHLAGALGKPVFILLPYTPDWRWGIEGDNSRWYPSARLFRQTRPEDWDAVVARVIAAARDFLRLSRSS